MDNIWIQLGALCCTIALLLHWYSEYRAKATRRALRLYGGALEEEPEPEVVRIHPDHFKGHETVWLGIDTADFERRVPDFTLTEKGFEDLFSTFSVEDLELLAEYFTTRDRDVPTILADAIASHTGSLTRQVGHVDHHPV